MMSISRATDQALASQPEPPVGAHIVTPRCVFIHHGIYVGRGRVVQYRGLSRGLRLGPVEEVSLSQFARGRTIWVRLGGSSGLDPYEVVRRARLRLGEDRYHLLTNNCEHFCEWCLRGEPRSYQVDELIAHCRRAWCGLIRVLAHVLFLRTDTRVPRSGEHSLHLPNLSD
jgi:Lecithin retinol acyltransferase